MMQSWQSSFKQIAFQQAFPRSDACRMQGGALAEDKERHMLAELLKFEHVWRYKCT